MTSFTLLVYTGFAMKFPEAWWAAPLIRWEGAFAIRGLIHRIAAIVMIALSFYHVIYLIISIRRTIMRRVNRDLQFAGATFRRFPGRYPVSHALFPQPVGALSGQRDLPAVFAAVEHENPLP